MRVRAARRADWDPTVWPMPLFSRIDEDGKALKVEYSEDDPSLCVREIPCSVQEAMSYSEDRMLGSHVLAHRLNALLGFRP